ncbi:hypothetical protein 7S2_29 [uncultured Caudovirales phage]|uniref:Uncharacterized protein n=1 Tax=uncultured Caudovirales phage TaxID=2100421 RepID=A0A2H4J9T5_9CAUD|nr:hypothetical protein 7S2_29 [uncultured Caudovirales phage]
MTEISPTATQVELTAAVGKAYGALAAHWALKDMQIDDKPEWWKTEMRLGMAAGFINRLDRSPLSEGGAA